MFNTKIRPSAKLAVMIIFQLAIVHSSQGEKFGQDLKESMQEHGEKAVTDTKRDNVADLMEFLEEYCAALENDNESDSACKVASVMPSGIFVYFP